MAAKSRWDYILEKGMNELNQHPSRLLLGWPQIIYEAHKTRRELGPDETQRVAEIQWWGRLFPGKPFPEDWVSAESAKDEVADESDTSTNRNGKTNTSKSFYHSCWLIIKEKASRSKFSMDDLMGIYKKRLIYAADNYLMLHGQAVAQFRAELLTWRDLFPDEVFIGIDPETGIQNLRTSNIVRSDNNDSNALQKGPDNMDLTAIKNPQLVPSLEKRSLDQCSGERNSKRTSRLQVHRSHSNPQSPHQDSRDSTTCRHCATNVLRVELKTHLLECLSRPFVDGRLIINCRHCTKKLRRIELRRHLLQCLPAIEAKTAKRTENRDQVQKGKGIGYLKDSQQWDSTTTAGEMTSHYLSDHRHPRATDFPSASTFELPQQDRARHSTSHDLFYSKGHLSELYTQDAKFKDYRVPADGISDTEPTDYDRGGRRRDSDCSRFSRHHRNFRHRSRSPTNEMQSDNRRDRSMNNESDYPADRRLDNHDYYKRYNGKRTYGYDSDRSSRTYVNYHRGSLGRHLHSEG